MTTIYIGFGASALVGLLAVLLYHLWLVAPMRREHAHLLASHDTILGGEGGSAASRLAAIEGDLLGLAGALERVAQRTSELEELARRDVSQVGFLRYDAFDDSTSELSYALAILSREGDGVVLLSIYSRTDTRTYGKAVERFKPIVTPSEEELRAIQAARSSSQS